MDNKPFTYHTPFIQGNKQRVTVVGEVNQQTNKMDFAVAMNSKKDIFCRRTGRKIALTRLKGASVANLDIPSEAKGKELSFFVEKAKELAVDILKQPIKVTRK